MRRTDRQFHALTNTASDTLLLFLEQKCYPKENLMLSEMRIGYRRAFTALVRDISERRRQQRH
jgi:hypothetical protein